MSKGKKIFAIIFGIILVLFLAVVGMEQNFIGMFLNQWIKPMKQ